MGPGRTHFSCKKAQNSAVFKYVVDKSEPLFSKNLDCDPSKLFFMLGELSGLIQQENSPSISSFIQTTKEKPATYQTLSIFQKLKYAGIFSNIAFNPVIPRLNDVCKPHHQNL